MSASAHDILLFGGSGKTGLHLIRHAQDKGLRVACLVREARDASELIALGVTIIRGDAFEPADCERALELAAPQSVVSLLGGKDAQGRRIDGTGNINVINAAQKWQAQLPNKLRFVLLTSMGCDEQYADLPPIAQTALKEALLAKTLAEQCLRQSTLHWTIVRPGGLNDQAAQQRYRLHQQIPAQEKLYLSRSDAALATLDLLLDTEQHAQAWTVLAHEDV